jgi:glutamyl/glutaminyl-tRNA synthetase
VITRIAPTPSGFLHLGNCVNFLLVDWLAQAQGGTVILRIDDIDADRFRPEYVDDVFRILKMLDVDWQEGPRTRTDFETSFAMRDRTGRYRLAAESLQALGKAYACECSRADLRAAGSRACVRDCRSRRVMLSPGATALRAHVPPGTTVAVGGHPVDLAWELGDFVLWRRDDQPSYQLASLVEDRDMGVTHIVRGEDLLASTAAQLFLAPMLGADGFIRAQFLHHRLVTDEQGHKLSKSQLGEGPLPADPSILTHIHEMAVEVGAPLGVAPPSP